MEKTFDHRQVEAQALLARKDIVVGRDRVARLIRVLGLAGATRAKTNFTTKADPEEAADDGTTSATFMKLS